MQLSLSLLNSAVILILVFLLMLILVSYTSEIINKTNQDHKFKVVVISINCKAYVNVLEFLDVTSIIAYIVMSTTVYKYMY